MPVAYDLRLATAWVEMPFDRSIHCYFQSANGIVPCIIKDDAVTLMAGSQPYEIGWRTITGKWGDQLAAIAEGKILESSERLVIIAASDLVGPRAGKATEQQ